MGKQLSTIGFVSALALAAVSTSVPVAAQRLPAASMLIADVDQIVAESNAGRAAATDLQTKVQALEQRAATLRQQLEIEAGAIRTGQQNNSLTGKALEDRIQAFEARKQAASEEIQRGQADLQRAQNYVSQQIGTALRPLITAYMQERGASMIVPSSAVLQHAAGLDATQELLTRLNAALPSVSTTPPSAPAAPSQR